MAETLELAKRLRDLGTIKVLDLRRAAEVRGILREWIHDGVYYLLPPEGVTAAQLHKLLDQYRDQDELHLAYNAQSAIDISHKPIIPLDSFAEKYFSDPPNGVVKVTAVARKKVAELNEIIDALKKPFDPQTFPSVEEVQLTEYKEPAEGRQTTVTLKLPEGDWKQVTVLEDGLKTLLAESNLLREILVSRHAVKDLQPEVTLTSTEFTTAKGNGFLVALAEFLIQNKQASRAVIGRHGDADFEEGPLTDEERRFTELTFAPRKDVALKPDSSQTQKTAIETMGWTLARMKGFVDREQILNGNLLMVKFPPKGITGLGGHFDKDHEAVLKAAYKGVRQTHMLESGWSAAYRYDKAGRTLSIKAFSDLERAPSGWISLR